MHDSLQARAMVHAALGDPTRLALVDELTTSDRSPRELADRLGIAPNLLAHHLDVLEHAGLVERMRSRGDGRRRYVRLRHERLPGAVATTPSPHGPALFVCTRNSARSPLGAAVWRRLTGDPAASAGTHPGPGRHPEAVAAAARHGLSIARRTRRLDDAPPAGLVITVCDLAREQVQARPEWLHWSLPDPAVEGPPAAFDRTIALLEGRITALLGGTPSRRPGDDE